MRSSDSSERSETSGSDSSDDEQAHPLDSYLAQRQAANEKDQTKKNPSQQHPSFPLSLKPKLKQQPSSSPESGELPQKDERKEEDFEDQLLSGSDTSSSSEDEEDEEGSDTTPPSSSAPPSSSGEESDDEKTEAPTTTHKIQNQNQEEDYVPVGVTVLAEGQQAERNAEMIRLLRMRRYFDDDFEENAKRCFKCGGAGHMARDCSNPPRLRSCFLCAEFGHDGRDCPNQLCWRCQKPGHQARDCPFISHNNNNINGNNKKKRVRAWDEEDTPTVCLRCGRPECPCAGYGDYARAEGGCTNSYKSKDMEKVRCYTCGQKGHLACSVNNRGATAAPPLPTKLSCYNCGDGGHLAENCWKEKPIPMRAERQRDRGSNGGSGGQRDRDRYDTYQPQERYQERHHERHHQQRHSYGDARGGGGGGDCYSQERRGGRYSEYNENSRKRRRHNKDDQDYYEDRSYAAQRNGGGGGSRGGGGGDSYKWQVHSNAYGALENYEYDGGDLYETPPQYRGHRKGNTSTKMKEKSRFSSGGSGGSSGKRGKGGSMPSKWRR